MHLHLDPVGGIAGDMFAAALLDAWPEHEAGLRSALAIAGLSAIVTVARRAHDDGVLTGSRFEVTPVEGEPGHHHDPHHHGAGHPPHRAWREVRALVTEADLPEGVRRRALDVFRLLGEAEAAVHGVPLEEVTFHEVGAWDSIADVVSAAWLIEAIGAQTWSCAPLPLGRGRVRTAHGDLAVPVPATTRLLEGFAVHDDGREGERVTPTGAAIVRHLMPAPAPPPGALRLGGSGTGFGTKRFEGISNVLRVLIMEPLAAGTADETIAVCAFEVDDQTPEDLAVALDRIRAAEGVLDVTQAPVFGKKGRMSVHVQVLARPAALDAALAACFEETATLGVRWHTVQRRALARDAWAADVDGHAVRVKVATRPDGSRTRKAEIADLAGAGAREPRERLRRAAESAAAPDPAGADGDG